MQVVLVNFSSNHLYKFAWFIFKPYLCFFSFPGLEAVITDPKENAVTLKNAKIVVELQKENQMQVSPSLSSL